MSITGKLHLCSSPDSAIVEMDQRYFTHPWTHEQWQSLDMESHALFSWNESGKVWGFALFQTLQGENAAHLYKILLLPEKRGDGTIRFFWNELSSHLRLSGFNELYLEVEASNGRAIKFYQKVGFQLLRIHKSYYSSGEDGHIMTMTL